MQERDDYADNDLPPPWRPSLSGPGVAALIATTAVVALLALSIAVIWAMTEGVKP